MIIKILKHILSLLDWIEYVFVYKLALLDGYKVTHIRDINNSNIKVETDTGFQQITDILNTKPFQVYDITLENGYTLECADNHILYYKDINDNICEIYCKDLNIDDKILTDIGIKKIVNIRKQNIKLGMVDISVNHPNHRFYSNHILSHNSTTTAIFALWSIVLRNDRNALILSKSGPAGRDLIKKIKDMYLYLPYHLKLGTLKWNQAEIAFDNNSTISTEAFSPTAGLGKTINFLILDEFAWCPPNDVELFYNNILPTVTADTSSNICIMSTQNGFNLFYKLWHAAETGQSMYGPFKVDWWQVPQWDPEIRDWKKRDEKWKQEMVGVLGSEEAFYYQYGTQFAASNNCLVSRECLSKLRDNTYLFETPEFDENSFYTPHREYFKFKKNYDISEMRNKWYVICVDLAEGGGNDYTVFNIFEIVDKDKFEQVGFWHCNTVDLENASVEFWTFYNQLFNPDKSIISVEWNTYGALFYHYLMALNEEDYSQETSWRYNVNLISKELETTSLVYYNKGNQEENIAGLNSFKNSKTVPGIRFSSSNKVTACALLKMMIEKGDINIIDLLTISELENFEDKNGNGSYAASYGHDDLIMTFCQIPMVKQTSRYKNFIEEYESDKSLDTPPSIGYDMYDSGFASNASDMYGLPSSPHDMLSSRFRKFSY